MQEAMKRYYEEIQKFKLNVPEKFSFPLDVFDRWGNSTALIWTDGIDLKNSVSMN